MKKTVPTLCGGQGFFCLFVEVSIFTSQTFLFFIISSSPIISPSRNLLISLSPYAKAMIIISYIEMLIIIFSKQNSIQNCRLSNPWY